MHKSNNLRLLKNLRKMNNKKKNHLLIKNKNELIKTHNNLILSLSVNYFISLKLKSSYYPCLI